MTGCPVLTHSGQLCQQATSSALPSRPMVAERGKQAKPLGADPAAGRGAQVA